MRAGLLALFVASALFAGCNQRCQNACEKILSCDNLDGDRLAQSECEDSCTRQDVLYEIWEDEEKMDAFDEHKKCIKRSTCEEIAAGECYDPLLFVIDEEKVSEL